MNNAGLIHESRLLTSAGVPHGFFTREQGVLPEHLDRLATDWKMDGLDSDRKAVLSICRALSVDHLMLPRQVHGTECWKPRGMATGLLVRGPEADGVISAEPGQAAGVITADCVPILMASPDGRVVAAVHGGWRGLFDGILRMMIQEIGRKSDGMTEDLLGVIGPSIGSCCYEVSDELAGNFQKRYPNRPEILRREGAKRFLSLQQVARFQMIESGLAPHRIETIEACTGCRADQFFSYRRQGGTLYRQVSAVAPKRE